MKTLFVVLPLCIKNYLETAAKFAFAASMKLGEYVKLLPDVSPVYRFGLYFENNASVPDAKTELGFVHRAVGWMASTDYLLFIPSWEKYKECAILHEIATAYGLSIIELDSKPEIELKPCPFCNAPSDELTFGCIDDEYYVECGHCGAGGPMCNDEAAAATAWNYCRGRDEAEA